jgi:hypothetical protein
MGRTGASRDCAGRHLVGLDVSPESDHQLARERDDHDAPDRTRPLRSGRRAARRTCGTACWLGSSSHHGPRTSAQRSWRAGNIPSCIMRGEELRRDHPLNLIFRPDCGQRHHGRAALTVSFLFLRMSHPKTAGCLIDQDTIPSGPLPPSGPKASRAYHAQEKTSLPGPQLAEFYFELVIPLLGMVGVDPNYPFPTCVG